MRFAKIFNVGKLQLVVMKEDQKGIFVNGFFTQIPGDKNGKTRSYVTATRHDSEALRNAEFEAFDVQAAADHLQKIGNIDKRERSNLLLPTNVLR
jgi:hypothetical protein